VSYGGVSPPSRDSLQLAAGRKTWKRSNRHACGELQRVPPRNSGPRPDGTPRRLFKTKISKSLEESEEYSGCFVSPLYEKTTVSCIGSRGWRCPFSRRGQRQYWLGISRAAPLGGSDASVVLPATRLRGSVSAAGICAAVPAARDCVPSSGGAIRTAL
jgi:hypothetical protein